MIRTMKVMTYTRIEMRQKHSTKEIGKNARYKWVLTNQTN